MSIENIEQWRSISGYQNYLVSDQGRIMMKENGKTMKISYTPANRAVVNLYHNGKLKTIQLSRLVASAFHENENNLPVVDHIDRNTHNNKASNLRWCTQKQNLMNSKKREGCMSIYKGVTYVKECTNNPWKATINNQGKQLVIGFFPDEKSAAKAYNKYAVKYYKEYAYLNEISDSE